MKLLLLLLMLPAQDASRLKEAMEGLGSAEIDVREAAEKTLMEAALTAPKSAIPLLLEASASKDAERGSRAKAVLDRLALTEVGDGSLLVVRVERDGKPVEGAVVIVERSDKLQRRNVPKEPVIVTFKEFVKGVRTLASGTTVRFGNTDNEIHNVHAMSAPHEVNIVVRPGSEEKVTLQEARYVVKCDVHPKEEFSVVATPHLAAAVTGAPGCVVFRGTAPGKVTLRAWLPSGVESETPFEITTDSATTVQLPPKK